ncbi:hypothetical protein RP29_11020 [Acidovorax temperans]|uniref:Uncharacterized protein n=1 Tax=Acidovorax temperans TaxID=80878 RepID=A0A0D7K875_9BURK|nr:hypothetical protein RP29_11020 [Acidovorax temperans]
MALPLMMFLKFKVASFLESGLDAALSFCVNVTNFLLHASCFSNQSIKLIFRRYVADRAKQKGLIGPVLCVDCNQDNILVRDF